MKITALLVLKCGVAAEEEATVLANASDVSHFGYFQHGSAKEFIIFVARTIAKRTPVGQRQSVKQEEYMVHAYKRNRLCGEAFVDAQYSMRSAFSILTKDPTEADKLLKIQKELDETKHILHKTIDNVLERGEKLDSLIVEKSSNLSLASQVVLPLQKLTHQDVFTWSEESEQQFREVKEILASLPTIAPLKWDENFYVNPTVGNDTLGTVLMQKDSETSYMRPIYFSSRMMIGPEKGYTPVEQMVLALMFATQKFRPYLLSKKFVILTVEEVFPYVLQHMDVSSRISKWLIRLQEFEYTVQVESSIEASLVGILTHCHFEKKVKPQGEEVLPSSKPVRLEEAHSLYFDGTYKRNINKATAGIVVFSEEGEKIFSTTVEIHHVPRMENQEADALAGEQLFEEVVVGAIVLKEPLFQGSDCMQNIVDVLNSGECPGGLTKGQRQWLVCKATSLQRDVHHWCKTFSECQKASDRRLTYEKQTPIISFGPFEKWDIDAIGPLPMVQSGKQYIIVGVDYMTRWAKAAAITAKDVAKFVFENICWRFGTPLEIISDRGPGFRGDLVGELMEQLGISRQHSSPYYPQCNGLVEKLASLRVLASGRDRPSEQLRSRILQLERLELDRTATIEHYAAQAEHRKQKFDENRKDKGLKRGMLVLRYDNHFDTRKDNKFMVRWEGPFLIYKKYTNGSYRLQDISGKLHKTRVNGWRLKPFFQRFDSTFMFDALAGTEEDEEEQPSSSHHHQH
ncbi:hypothetical protein L7F22_065552 [Adiantum nelumboides]|nr:hypothetical protein [Adiantum nelumboides]